MANCLITKLKASVDNDDLDIYGVFTMKIKAGAFEVRLKPGIGSHIYFDNSADTINMGSTAIQSGYTIPNWGDSYDNIRLNGTLTKDTVFKFDSLYTNSLISITLEASYVNNITFGKNLETSFKYGDYTSVTMSRISLTNNVDISAFSNSEHLTAINVPNHANKTHDFIGSIDNLHNVPLLGSIVIKDAPNLKGSLSSLAAATSGHIGTIDINRTGITGRCEDFVEVMTAYRDSGNTTIGSTTITFNGNLVGGLKCTFTATGCEVYDNANNTHIGTYTKASGTWSYD